MAERIEELLLSSEEAAERAVLIEKTRHLSALDTADADVSVLRVVREELVDWLFRFPDDAPLMRCLEWLDTRQESTARQRG